MNYSANIEKLKHSFLPVDFKLTSWETISPFFILLNERKIKRFLAQGTQRQHKEHKVRR
jgi:hypothetical protein